MRRVVITGVGAVSPHGLGAPAFWNALVEGRSSTQTEICDGSTPFDRRNSAAAATTACTVTGATCSMAGRVSGDCACDVAVADVVSAGRKGGGGSRNRSDMDSVLSAAEVVR